jgi:hypothetical protein
MSGSALNYYLFLNGTTPEHGSRKFPQKVCNFLPIETPLHPTRIGSRYNFQTSQILLVNFTMKQPLCYACHFTKQTTS